MLYVNVFFFLGSSSRFPYFLKRGRDISNTFFWTVSNRLDFFPDDFLQFLDISNRPEFQFFFVVARPLAQLCRPRL
jgi:hypothetical protein